MSVRPAFFTACYYKDYDLLLGAIEHHAEMGRHVVLDTSPPEKVLRFSKLPDTVLWIHEPLYGEGWKSFRLRTALERALKIAKLVRSDVLTYLDADEFYVKEATSTLFHLAEKAMVEVQVVHWKADGNAYAFGPSEWHCRLWPTEAEVQIGANEAWTRHPRYDGNPENHPVPVAPAGLPVIRAYGQFRHHLHHALGPKVGDEENARNTIDGWPDGGKQVQTPPLPERLRQWKEGGPRPSEAFL